MEILIHKSPLNQYYEVGIYAPEDSEREAEYVRFNDTAHLKLGEIEALSRAKGFHTLTGWPIIKKYELD